ncbi:MAG: adaptor protein MecA [Kineothrix sp.]|nr:adaptor protein MecA [Kineothrix sp.]NBI91413.1 adaptor protein MecA [Lachnospiraceae bacterium]
MKIEKVNDHQIRCTLTREDLADRELKISELAYGTEKAKNLFRDMMQQASYEFGFEAEDIPLMIEAIPLNSECIVLIITKVEDPEELDTRFSKFAPSVHDSDGDLDEMLDSLTEGADDVLDLFKKIHEGKFADALEKTPSPSQPREKQPKKSTKKQESDAGEQELVRIFSFDSIRTVTRISHVLAGSYDENNSLYKNENAHRYILVVSKGGHTPEQFNKVCNILSEYGTVEKYVSAGEAYLEEHFNPIIKENALQSLCQI